MQPGLFGEVVPFLPLLVKESGFLPTTRDKGLKEDQCQNTKIHEERRKQKERISEHLASRNDNITQNAPGLVQSFQHGQDPLIETLPQYALSSIIEQEEYRRRVLRIHPLEQWLAPRG